MNVLSSTLTVCWDAEQESLLILHPDRMQFEFPLIEIRDSTLNSMDWPTACQFIGERLVLLIPALREKYIDTETGRLRGVEP
ncbi:MAG TPA: hypothetical protein VN084_07380 [Methylophilaceae bacterium]|nr:hypothetical protein [Methylophilaceae bacterium]